MKKLLLTMTRAPFLIGFGGMLYYNFEILCRGYSHISMIFCGGLSFYSIGLLNETKKKNLSFFAQMFLGGIIITIYEFITGIIVNIRLHLNVWDYSNLPLNYKGQICFPFSLLWVILSGICIVLDDYIRYLFFGKRKPSYQLFHRKK